MSTYDIIRDVVAASEPTEGFEIEIRVPVPDHCLDLLRAQIGAGQPVTYAESKIMYANQTDVRCVGELWQRKRLVNRTLLPAIRGMSICVSIESPASAPAYHPTAAWHATVRQRWTYRAGAWTVMLTRSGRGANIEVEYGDDYLELRDAARRDRAFDLRDLALHLDPIMACVSFLNRGRPVDCFGDGNLLPLIRLRRYACRLSRQRCNSICKQMQACQPVSLQQSSLVVPERPLVSLKFDGVRVVLDVASDGVVYGVCRRGYTWHIPAKIRSRCVSMVLDCEFVKASKTFVVFDVYETHGRPLATVDYSARLHLLQQLDLPDLHNYKIVIKTVYPFCVLSDEWYREQCEQHRADGIIVHSGTSKLADHAKLYKWKPVHTVDLYVGDDGMLMDGSYTAFVPACTDHGKKLAKGEVWECQFVNDCKAAQPLRRRHDKCRANARHVCREIRQAHRDALGLAGVRKLLQQGPARQSKKRSCTQMHDNSTLHGVDE